MSEGTARRGRTERRLQALEEHTGSVYTVVLAADGTRAVSTSQDRTLRIWNLESGRLLAKFECHGPTRSCAVSSDHLTVVAGDGVGMVYLLHLEGFDGAEHH